MDVEAATQARWEFDRCATDADFAGWARRWGEHLRFLAEDAAEDFTALKETTDALEEAQSAISAAKSFVAEISMHIANLPEVLDVYLVDTAKLLSDLAELLTTD